MIKTRNEKPETRNQNDPFPRRILIVKLSAIGDVVHALPFLEALRRGFPGALIDWAVEEEAFPIIKGHPALNRIIVSRRRSWNEGMRRVSGWRSVRKEAVAFLKDLRACEYDLIVDLQGLLKSGLLTGLARGRRKIGMTGSREGARFFLNEPPVPVDYSQHAIERYLDVAASLPCDRGPRRGRIPVSENDKRRVDYLLGVKALPGKRLVGINPMARWETKLWEERRFAALADRLQQELDCSVVFTGSEDDRRGIERILGLMATKAVNLAGSTGLKELAYFYSICDALVSTDTGPMHIAAAMGCPVIALFGPTAPLRTGPYGDGHRVVRAGISCSPCFRKKCKDIRCMDAIAADVVFDAARDVLADRRGSETRPSPRHSSVRSRG